MKTTAIISLLFVLLASVATASLADTWYVKSDSSGDAPTIQAAIDLADSGDVILLAPTHVDTPFTGYGNTNVDFRGLSVTITSELGPDMTIIDCGGAARGFIFQNGEGPGSVLRGVTIKNGLANFYGGGVYCKSSSPTIEGNQFVSNLSGYQGGAVYCDSSGAVIDSNLFVGNSAPQGGALWCSGGSNLTVRGNRFEDNGSMGPLVTELGGAFACDESSPLISGNRFEGNDAYVGAALDVSPRSGPVIQDNIFERNSALADGGGVRCRASSGLTAITDNVFWRNRAERGGAIYLGSNSQGGVTSNTIVENHASAGAGIFCTDYSQPTIESNIIAYCSGGDVVEIANFAQPSIGCCDLYLNQGGDDIPSGADDQGNNIFDNPQFCYLPSDGRFHLASSSPCLPENNEYSCALIGARPMGCSATGTGETTVHRPLRLDPNLPNPFNISTTIRFHVDRDRRDIRVLVFDVDGALVRTLFEGSASAGPNSIAWDGRDQAGRVVSSGVYFCVLSSRGYKEAHKMVLLK